MVRVVVVEDALSIRKLVRHAVERHDGFVVVGEAATVSEGRKLIRHQSPDFLLLDVVLGDGTSFDLLQEFHEEFGRVPFRIIFLTAYEQYAIDAIKHSALDYLLKPIDEGELSNALWKVLNIQPIPIKSVQITNARQWITHNKPSRIIVRSQHFLHLIDIEELLMLVAMREGYTTFYLTGDRKVLSTKHLKTYEDMLASAGFLRTHKSYIVNPRFIASYHIDGLLIMKYEHQIPVAERKRHFIVLLLKRG
jgi:Response regulator of the LytR/AlgR family